MSILHRHTHTHTRPTRLDRYMQPTELVTKAGNLVRDAQDFESAGNLTSALNCYEQALLIFKSILQNTQYTHLRAKINNYANDCLLRAQFIRESIQNGTSSNGSKQFTGSSRGCASDSNNNNSQSTHLRTSNDESQVGEEKRRMMQDLSMTRIDPNELNVYWDDIVGMREIKKILTDAIQLPREMPHLFNTGTREATRSVLLYGPPGTGKTLIGKALACESGIPFYAVSSAELISKFVGESEKYVKSLFDMVKHDKPCILFIDELESLCARREETSHTKTVQQFLIQLDGISTTGSMEGVFLMGCTNAPWSLDEAMIRRLEKRVYIALPTEEERDALIRFYMTKNTCRMNDREFKKIASMTEHFSAADIKQLSKAAAMYPLDLIRNASYFELLDDGGLLPCERHNTNGIPMTYESIVDKSMIREPPITFDIVCSALKSTKTSIDVDKLTRYTEWTNKSGQ